jgi:carbamoyl-phosphate synthase small subunit
VDDVDEAKALAAAKGFPGLKGMDLAKVVSVKESTAGGGYPGRWAKAMPNQQRPKRFNVVAYDYGVKRNILRMLVDRWFVT